MLFLEKLQLVQLKFKIMCVCPLRIKNNKLDFDPLIDRFYNYVPCGQCYECQESIRNGYEVRSLYEYIYTQSIGGCTYYITLTYNDKFVPHLPGTDIMVGSKDDVQRFIKRLRKKFEGINIKYFIVLEYGHKNFRPHYHGFLYFDSNIQPERLNKEVKECWALGFVCFGENRGFVKDARAFSYVSKYCTKDVVFNKYINNSGSPIVIDYMSNTLEFRNKFSLGTFHLQSQHFGLSICNKLTDSELVKGYFVSNDIVGLNRKLAIPLYILRYLLYDKVKNSNNTISYRLNNRGIEIFRKKMLYQYKKYCQDFKDLLTLSLDFEDVFLNSPTAKRCFLTFDNYKKCISKDFDNLVSPIVAYKLLYHDVDYIPFSFENFREDLEIYINTVFKTQWLATYTGEKYECPFSDDNKLLLEIITEICSYFRYKIYLTNTYNYNRQQFHKKLVTGEYKPKPILSYGEFLNNVPSFKKYRVCSTTLENNPESSLLISEFVPLTSSEIR